MIVLPHIDLHTHEYSIGENSIIGEPDPMDPSELQDFFYRALSNIIN